MGADGIWRYRLMGDLLVMAATGEPSDELLDKVLEEHRSRRARRGVTYCVGSPSMSAAQRRRAAEALKGVQTLAITESALTRGIVTAMGWLGSNMRAAAPDNLVATLEQYGAPAGFTASEVAETLEELRSEVERELRPRKKHS